jgi:hypothetical protein
LTKFDLKQQYADFNILSGKQQNEFAIGIIWVIFFTGGDELADHPILEHMKKDKNVYQKVKSR